MATKVALEGQKNTLLASSQPITAAIHRTWGLATTPTVLSLLAGDKVLIIRGADTKLIDKDAFGGGVLASIDAGYGIYIDDTDPANPIVNNFSPWKQPAQCATTANITLTGEQTIDGFATSLTRVLVKNQSAPAENGVYISAPGAWARDAVQDAGVELQGAVIVVTEGSTNANTAWQQTADGITIGSTSIVWVRFGGATIGGTIGATQVAFGASTDTLTGEGDLTFEASPNRLNVGASTSSSDGIIVVGGSGTGHGTITGGGGALTIEGGDLTIQSNPTHFISIKTNTIERVRFTNAGEMQVNGSSGTAGNALISGGAGATL